MKFRNANSVVHPKGFVSREQGIGTTEIERGATFDLQLSGVSVLRTSKGFHPQLQIAQHGETGSCNTSTWHLLYSLVIKELKLGSYKVSHKHVTYVKGFYCKYIAQSLLSASH